MNRTEYVAISSHLTTERDRLLMLIAAIQQSGRIAPAHCWLTESPQTKGNRTYIYIRLVCEPPGQKLTSKSLGKPSSKKHQDWHTAIARREAIAELEQQLKLLEALIDRQAVGAERIAVAVSLANQQD